MKLILDVGYFDNAAKVVGLVIDEIGHTQILQKVVDNPMPYVPGEFYKRELPCLMALINDVPINQLEYIIIDGYVYVDNDELYGLGGHLYRALAAKVPIIGVAKTFYKGNEQTTVKVVRGQSKSPLFVSSIGIDLNKAAHIIETMQGPNRIPDLIKKVDTLTKQLQ